MFEPKKSRRQTAPSRAMRGVLTGSKCLLGCAALSLSIASAASAPAGGAAFCDLTRAPDAVSVVTEQDATNLAAVSPGQWEGLGVTVATRSESGGLGVELKAPAAAVKHLRLHWNLAAPTGWKYLGDDWERAYGDLEWKPMESAGTLAWYFLATDGTTTHGYGVMTGASAMCAWFADTNGITLDADVRCGGMGVQLGARTLKVGVIVCRQGLEHETPFQAAQAFCRVMCPKPRLPRQPVFGFNDWYCSYGKDTSEKFLSNIAFVVSLAPKNGNRPYAVVDDGWQVKGDLGGTNGPGQWFRTSPSFSSNLTMPEFAKLVRAAGARPGIWVRPLIASRDQPAGWRLARRRDYLDPTVPEVRAYVREVMGRLHGWGFELIKHDYSTYDITGQWESSGQKEVTRDGWAFADRSRTTAEVIRAFYQDIRDGAGDDAVILGCNTIGHLSAGIFEMQRIGDDTSGQEWARTRKMGVNCLAFRAPQHGTFFAVDGDCAGQTSANSVPWEKNSQWLDLLARSGTPLFVSFPHDTVSPEQTEALRKALTAAAGPQKLAEPLDWLDSKTPSHWLLNGQEAHFTW
jgi:alpha-galactosidase